MAASRSLQALVEWGHRQPQTSQHPTRPQHTCQLCSTPLPAYQPKQSGHAHADSAGTPEHCLLLTLPTAYTSCARASTLPSAPDTSTWPGQAAMSVTPTVDSRLPLSLWLKKVLGLKACVALRL